MLYKAAFDQGMCYVLRQKLSTEKERQYYFEMITYDLSIYDWTMISALALLVVCYTWDRRVASSSLTVYCVLEQDALSFA